MFVDIAAFDEFYSGPVGNATSQVIRIGLSDVWGKAQGQHCLGIGYTFPYLETFGGDTASCAAITPARLGPSRWSLGGSNCTAMANLRSLPLANAAYDRILIIHAMDFTREREAFLAEVARIMSPGGQVALIVANRAGAWARNDTTPFGQGEPYSRRQLRHLIEGANLSTIRTKNLLFLPPFPRLSDRRWGGNLEKLGSKLWPGLGGLILMTAKKWHPEEVKARQGVLNVSPATAASRG